MLVQYIDTCPKCGAEVVMLRQDRSEDSGYDGLCACGARLQTEWQGAGDDERLVQRRRKR